MNIDQQQGRETPGALVQDLLHAIGQPLTSLQMCVLLRDQPAWDLTEIASVMHDMAGQVTLLSRLFETLRRILDVEPAPRVTLHTLERLLPSFLPQWQQVARRRNITITTTGLPKGSVIGRDQVVRDALETCLEEVVAAALESTPDNGGIAVTLISQSVALPSQLRILGGTLLSEASFAARFALPAAMARLNSADQEFTYRRSPFEAHLILLPPASLAADAAILDRAPSPPQDHAGLPG